MYLPWIIGTNKTTGVVYVLISFSSLKPKCIVKTYLSCNLQKVQSGSMNTSTLADEWIKPLIMGHWNKENQWDRLQSPQFLSLELSLSYRWQNHKRLTSPNDKAYSYKLPKLYNTENWFWFQTENIPDRGSKRQHLVWVGNHGMLFLLQMSKCPYQPTHRVS